MHLGKEECDETRTVCNGVSVDSVSAAKPLAVVHNWRLRHSTYFPIHSSTQKSQASLWINPNNFTLFYYVLARRRATNFDAVYYLILVDHNDFDGGLWYDQLANRLLQFHGVDILRKCHVSVASDALYKTWRAETI